MKKDEYLFEVPRCVLLAARAWAWEHTPNRHVAQAGHDTNDAIITIEEVKEALDRVASQALENGAPSFDEWLENRR